MNTNLSPSETDPPVFLFLLCESGASYVAVSELPVARTLKCSSAPLVGKGFWSLHVWAELET